jgi:hypothetical protein
MKVNARTLIGAAGLAVAARLLFTRRRTPGRIEVHGGGFHDTEDRHQGMSENMRALRQRRGYLEEMQPVGVRQPPTQAGGWPPPQP